MTISEELGQETGTNHFCQNLSVKVIAEPKLIQREETLSGIPVNCLLKQQHPPTPKKKPKATVIYSIHQVL